MKVYEIISEEKIDELINPAGLVKGGLGLISRGADAAATAWKARKTAKAGKDALKVAANAKVPVEVANKVKSFGTTYLSFVNALGIVYFIYDYWKTILPIENDFDEFSKAIKNKKEVSKSNQFAGMTYEQALGEAEGAREQALGKAVAGILLTGGLIGKFISSIGTFFSIFGPIGTLIGMPLRGIGYISQALGAKSSPAVVATARAALIVWLEKTESGQAFMKNAMTALVLGGVGKVAAAAIDSVISLADEFLKWLNETEWGKKLGLNLAVPDAAKTKVKSDPETEKEVEVKTINGVPAITSDGYLRADRSFWINSRIKSEIERAQAAGKPHPLAGIPRNPKLQYPTDLFRSMDYTPN